MRAVSYFARKPRAIARYTQSDTFIHYEFNGGTTPTALEKAVSWRFSDLPDVFFYCNSMMGNSPNLEKPVYSVDYDNRADAATPDRPLIAWKATRRRSGSPIVQQIGTFVKGDCVREACKRPVDATRRDGARAKRAKSRAGKVTQRDSDDFLFYVDKVVLSMRSVERSFPTFRSWSNELLRAREQAEITTGAFGWGFVEADVPTVVGRHHHQLDRVGVSTNNGEAKSTMEHSVQAYVQEFTSKTRLLATIGDEILKLVENAPQVLMRLITPRLPNENSDHPATNGAGVSAEPVIVEGVGLQNKYCVTAADVDDELAQDDEAHVSPRPKRRIKLGSANKSPYKEREIDVTKKLDGNERMVANWIMKNDASDEVVVICPSVM
ncbi:type III pantothenate kinase, partial [Striga asiatica]